MPIPTVCPHCQTNYTLADHLAGKNVRCKNCDEVIPVPKSAEGSGRHERIQKEARPAKAPAREEAPPRIRQRDRDSRPRSSGGNRGLLIGLIGCAVLLLLVLTAGGVGLFFWLSGKSGSGGGGVSDLLVDVGGPWPEPMVPARMGQMPPELTVTIHVANVEDEFTRDDVSGRLGKLVDVGRGSGSVSSSNGSRMTIRLYPVQDPKAFADKIDFATVRGVSGRTITLVARKVEGAPPPNADAVSKALFRLKSNNVALRHQALRTIKDTLPDERRGEVVKALEPLVNDSDHFTREWAIEALGVWGTKETVPILLKAMKQKESRGAAMKALGHLKDERAIEPIADRLEDFFDRGPAAEALKKMGPAAENAVLKQMNHTDNQVRLTACDILKTIGTAKSLPALRRAVAEGDFFLKPKAEETIKAIKARQG